MYSYKKLPDLSPNWLYNFALPTKYASFLVTHLSTFTVVRLFNFSHTGGYVTVPHCGFNLHFPGD